MLPFWTEHVPRRPSASPAKSSQKIHLSSTPLGALLFLVFFLLDFLSFWVLLLSFSAVGAIANWSEILVIVRPPVGADSLQVSFRTKAFNH